MNFSKKISMLLLVSVLLFTSCSKENENDIAYCFSMVFDKTNSAPTVTLYCKIHDKQSENGTLTDTSFTFSSENFTDAMLQADKHSHKIYYNSTKAVFFGNNVTHKEKKDIILFFMNNSKYQSSVYVYLPYDNASNNQDIRMIAREICKNEKIDYYDKEKYVKAVEIITFYYVGMALGRFLSGVVATKLHSWIIIKIGHPCRMSIK